MHFPGKKLAMADFEKIVDVLLSVQDKHHQFFKDNNCLITEYIEIPVGLIPVLKIKKGLPQNIIDDINNML